MSFKIRISKLKSRKSEKDKIKSLLNNRMDGRSFYKNINNNNNNLKKERKKEKNCMLFSLNWIYEPHYTNLLILKPVFLNFSDPFLFVHHFCFVLFLYFLFINSSIWWVLCSSFWLKWFEISFSSIFLSFFLGFCATKRWKESLLFIS